MLGIDRHDLTAALPRRLCNQLARHHQRFLVRERDPFAGTQRGERRLEPGGTHDAIHDDLHVGMRRGFDEAGSTLPPSPLPRPPTIHQADECRPPVLLLFGEQIAILHYFGVRVVMIHGGGPQVTELQNALGLEARMVHGRRVTYIEQRSHRR